MKKLKANFLKFRNGKWKKSQCPKEIKEIKKDFLIDKYFFIELRKTNKI